MSFTFLAVEYNECSHIETFQLNMFSIKSKIDLDTLNFLTALQSLDLFEINDLT